MLSSTQPRMLWSPLQSGVLLVGSQLAAQHTPRAFPQSCSLACQSPAWGSSLGAGLCICTCWTTPLAVHLARPYQPHLDTAMLWETVSPCPQLYNRNHFIIVIRACINFHCYETAIGKAEYLQSTFAHVHTRHCSHASTGLHLVKPSGSHYISMIHCLTTPGTASPGILLFYFPFCLIPFPIHDFHCETNLTNKFCSHFILLIAKLTEPSTKPMQYKNILLIWNFWVFNYRHSKKYPYCWLQKISNC